MKALYIILSMLLFVAAFFAASAGEDTAYIATLVGGWACNILFHLEVIKERMK